MLIVAAEELVFVDRHEFLWARFTPITDPFFFWCLLLLSQKQSAMPRPEPIRGRQVYILSGKYFINNGVWINEAEGDGGFTAESVYVLVRLKSDKLVGTRLKKDTVSNYNNYDEAVLDQHPMLRKAMGEQAKKIAKYNIEDTSVYAKEFLKMLKEAQQVSLYRTTFNAPARK
jgi:hypothetical protein